MNVLQEQEQEMRQLEISIETAKRKIELAEALAKLQKNKAFKDLILTEYLGNYAIHLVKNKASFGMQDETNQNFINDQITAIGHLDQFLRYTAQEGIQAKQALSDDRQTEEEILAEGV